MREHTSRVADGTTMACEALEGGVRGRIQAWIQDLLGERSTPYRGSQVDRNHRFRVASVACSPKEAHDTLALSCLSTASRRGALGGRPAAMRKPDFYIVGAPKAGTTSLYRYLRQHPQIFLPDQKEPRFFVDDDYLRGRGTFAPRPVRCLSDYLALFAGVPECVRAGEASTSYLHCQTSATRIHEFTPDARIVVMLRDPVDRAYSHYGHRRKSGREVLSFEEAIATEKERPAPFRYVHNGFYARQLKRYLDLFGKDSVGVFFLEDMAHDAVGLCRQLFSFLQVDATVEVDVSTIHNAAARPRSARATRLYKSVTLGDRAYLRVAKRLVPPRVRRAARSAAHRMLLTRRVPPIREETRRALVDRYRAEVRELEVLTGRDLGHWLR